MTYHIDDIKKDYDWKQAFKVSDVRPAHPLDESTNSRASA